jgi:hypothetical protein
MFKMGYGICPSSGSIGFVTPSLDGVRIDAGFLEGSKGKPDYHVVG